MYCLLHKQFLQDIRKEGGRFSKENARKCDFLENRDRKKTNATKTTTKTKITTLARERREEADDVRNALGSVTANVCLVSASILHDLSDMQPQINAIKIEHPPYYCSSYTPPSAATAADHAQPAASFSEFQNLYVRPYF